MITAIVLAAVVTTGAAEPSQPNCPEPVAGGVVKGTSTGGKNDAQVPRLISKQALSYPADLNKKDKLGATVILQGTVDIDGKVGSITTLTCATTRDGTVLEGDEKAKYCEKFSAAAAAAFAGWRYEPAKRGDKSVCVYIANKFTFAP
jgi:hypothetical protein